MSDFTDQYVDALQRAGLRARRVDEPWLGLVLVEGVGELTQGQCADLLRSVHAERDRAFRAPQPLAPDMPQERTKPA